MRKLKVFLIVGEYGVGKFLFVNIVFIVIMGIYYEYC